MNTPRTLIIGLDGATFDLIEPWAKMGFLPTFARLMTKGTYGPLLAWPNMDSAAAWSSMVTGYNPGQHGIYFLATYAQQDNRLKPVTAADRKKDPFWRLLSAVGKKVGVINVPISYPVDSINGFMLAGMDAPSIHSPGFAHPPNLYDKLRRQGIDYMIDVPNSVIYGRGTPQRVLQAIQHMVDVRSQAVLYLMETHPWDVLMAVFVAVDKIQHRFWPKEPLSVENFTWEPIRRIYQKLDSFLKEAIELIGSNTTVFVVSDHGFGPVLQENYCLNQLFTQLGLLQYGGGRSRLKGRLLKNLLFYGQQIIPHWLQNPLVRIFPNLYHHAINETLFSDIDWSKTQVVATPNVGHIYINLKGRESEGIVPPENYHFLREHIRDILINLTDENTGRPLILGVYRPEDIYHGPYIGKAGDLIIQWDYRVLRDSICYRTGGQQIVIRPPQKIRSQKWKRAHNPFGIFIAYGPHIKQGKTIMNATLYDIAPTILHLQGHPIPKDMDGKVLTDILIDDHLNREIQRS